jgi:hypothetical protein
MDIGGLVSIFFKNAGPGGVVVMLIFGTACIVYYFLTRWIVAGGQSEATAAPDEQLVSIDV